MTRSEILEYFKNINVIQRESVTLRSGERSNFYCDIKKSFGDPELLDALTDELVKFVDSSVTCIAASGHGGLPIASIVALKTKKKFVAVRNSKKDHGKNTLLDGYIPTNKDVVLIVDDVLTSGSSLEETVSALNLEEGKINKAVVIVARKEPELSIPYSFIFSIEELFV